MTTKLESNMSVEVYNDDDYEDEDSELLDDDEIAWNKGYDVGFEKGKEKLKEELKDKIKEIKWDRDTTQDFDEVINKILELIDK